ncbi:MAG: hypothetical protein GF346_00660 [Candidatus Eisenbacteria bacterium]|nr:hypothetical protein [Candidatus Latescibacterota bacterium]MBD3300942.1 hypothetical protein [Candidatus Eisenbacteria bacterium]
MRIGTRMGRIVSAGLAVCAAAAAATGTPAPQGSVLTRPADRGIDAVETIRIVTRWDAPGYEIAPDFGPLDGGSGGPAAIVDSSNGAYLIVYTTGTMADSGEVAGIPVPITARDPADGSTFTDTSLEVCRRHRSPVPEHRESGLAGAIRRHQSGDTLRLVSTWRVAAASGFTLSADFTSFVPDFRASEATVDTLAVDTLDAGWEEIRYEVRYTVPGRSRLAGEANAVPVHLIGRDTLCTELRIEAATFDVRTGPPPSPIEHRVVSPADRGVRPGDTVEIHSRWDGGGYTLIADFDALDGGTGGSVAVFDSSAVDTAAIGSYLIRYTPGSMNGLPDAAVPVPITATDSLADSFTDRSLEVCRNQGTPGPIHLESVIRDGRTRFRGTDSLVVVSRWESPAGLPLEVEADYRRLVPEFGTDDAPVVRQEDGSFLVLYRIPPRERLAPDADSIRLTLLARDSLCSVTRYDGIIIELDTTPPAESPTFDPLPAQTNTSPIRMSGTAPAAARVAIQRNDTFQFTVEVDEDDRFETLVDLVEGSNKLGGYAEDEVGNKTVPGSSQIVLYVAEAAFTYPTPLRPGDEIVARDTAGIDAVDVEIYNLEGDLIRRIESDGGGLEVRLAWSGLDRNGDRVQPGYYLMRTRRKLSTGTSVEEVLPLLVRSD